MIISFCDNIFDIDDPNLRDGLAEIFHCIINDRCLVSVGNLIDIFYNENGEYIFDSTDFSRNYLSKSNRAKLRDYIDVIIDKDAYLTDQHVLYLSSYTVGFDHGNISISDALAMLTNSSRIILENATNDWKFIKGIVEKYRNHDKRKSIYKLIEKSINNIWLEAEQAGGKGQIKSRIEDLFQKRYRNIGSKIIMALFDSDRSSENEIDNVIKQLIEFIKNKEIHTIAEAIYEPSDMLTWHMLYKREAENYVPVEIIVANIEFDGLEAKLSGLDPRGLDFIKYETYLKGIPVKRDFPDFFLRQFTKDKIEERCRHHTVDIETSTGTLEQVSEIEFILLKIAKII